MGMGTKIVGMGTFCEDRDTAGGDGAGWGLAQWRRDGDRDNEDDWGQILVPMQLSIVEAAVVVSSVVCFGCRVSVTVYLEQCGAVSASVFCHCRLLCHMSLLTVVVEVLILTDW